MTAALALRGLGKDYGSRKAVGAIDLEVVRGECLGLLGPNGAGKTTTISMACGVVTPSRGTVAIGGVDLARDPHAAKAKLGLVPQELAIYEELSALQNLRYFGALYGLHGAALASKIDWALGVVGLADRASEPAKRYSGGMKRRLNLAAGLVHEPELLVLDEPTVGVDPQSRNHIFETVKALRAKGMTVVYTSHYMEEVEALCDRVAIMDGGAIVALGSISELIAAHAGKGIELALAGTPEAIDAALAAAAPHGVIERRPAVTTGTRARTAVNARGAGEAANATGGGEATNVTGGGEATNATGGDEAANATGGEAANATSAVRVVPKAGLGPLLAAIEGAGVTIARIESREANLETAFLKLTGKTLRDEAA